MKRNIFIFYGYSGSKKKPTPSHPDGTDHDRSLQLTAETLGESLQALYPSDRVQVIQTWSKDQLLAALSTAGDGTIRQVHVCTHGDSTMLSLAFRFDGGRRLLARAKKFNARSGTARERALEAMREEDAIIAGFFSRALDPKRLAALKAKHTEDASWQIWGCFAGYDQTAFRGIGDTHVDRYLKRFNLGQARIDGVAVDIAKSLGVSVTAAKGAGGLEFWHGTAAGQVVRNDARTAAKKPFWLWNAAQSTWVTFDSSGALKSQPEIFQIARSAAQLGAGKPPKWLTDLYYKAASAVRAPAVAHGLGRPLSLSQARARREQRRAGVARAFYDDGGPAPDLYGVAMSHGGRSARASAPTAQALGWPAAEPETGRPLPVISPSLELVTEAQGEVTSQERDRPQGELAPSFVPSEVGRQPQVPQGATQQKQTRQPAQSPPATQQPAGPEVADDDVPMEAAEELFAQAPAGAQVEEPDDDQDDFRKKLEAALRGEGEYADRAQAQATRAEHQAQEAGGAPPHADPFSQLHPDLVQAKTYDLGSHALSDELDDLAEQTLSAGETSRRMPEPRPTRSQARAQAPELDELDVLAALATAEPDARRSHVLDTEGETTATRPASPAPAAEPAPRPVLKLGQKVPDASETSVVGEATGGIKRGTPAFEALVRNDNPDILYKDEEGSDADLMMTPRLAARLNDLAILVGNEWPELKLRVTEAWDEDIEHSKNSLHYEARAADITVGRTVNDSDTSKLGRLAQLAVDAGLDFVLYEDSRHVHVSVKKEPAPGTQTESSDESSEEKTS
ncbi:MAG: hypothetical protein PVI30_05945 [Myxococcales bacterium]|jgi:hypothetical protein